MRAACRTPADLSDSAPRRDGADGPRGYSPFGSSTGVVLPPPLGMLVLRAEAPAAAALIVRCSGGSRSLVKDIRDALLHAIDPNVALGPRENA